MHAPPWTDPEPTRPCPAPWPGAPGVAIGINQSACSLGSALGPILCGLGYTQSLYLFHTSVPFFAALGCVGLLPGAATQLLAPRWPW